jgi:ABC-2 type transport system permease protein
MSAEPTREAFVLPAATLWQREVVRFVRQRGRIVGALGTPVVFWLLIGSGFRDSFRAGQAAPGVDFLEYMFPGTVVLILLFTAIFSNISIIEDRREGFLQAVLAAPVRRSAIVVGKVAGSATLAVAQAGVFLLLGPLAGLSPTLPGVIAGLGALVLLAVGLSALGFLVAWPMDSTQGFHAVMNLFLMPLWLLSGAFFPASGASGWVRGLMAANPLTYGVAALRHGMYLGSPEATGMMPSPAVAWLVTAAFAAGMVVLAERAASR